uniref:Uncharacterized protein n=1 Tax=Arundo donax TaxID=35708 RepID=A0A0A9H4H9_ARUDO
MLEGLLVSIFLSNSYLYCQVILLFISPFHGRNKVLDVHSCIR